MVPNQVLGPQGHTVIPRCHLESRDVLSIPSGRLSIMVQEVVE